MKPAPKDWPRLSSAIFYQDAARAIEWLVEAFGFEVRLRIEGEDGRIEHSELTFGGALVMVGQEDIDGDRPWRRWMRSPRSVGQVNTQALMIYVDDVDASCAQATAHGATVVTPCETHDYGDDYWVDRTCALLDCEGHLWWFAQRLRDQPSHG